MPISGKQSDIYFNETDTNALIIKCRHILYCIKVISFLGNAAKLMIFDPLAFWCTIQGP